MDETLGHGEGALTDINRQDQLADRVHATHTQCGERDRRLTASTSVMSPSLTALRGCLKTSSRVRNLG